ncbi:MAG: murein biosynthesis integral membrane protein MurJ [Clostridia bacterium]
MARDAGMVMLLILASRLLGYVRERAIADVFGLSIETDIFRLAFNIPDLMYFLLIAGGLNAAFIPVFTGYLARGEEDEGWRVAATFFSVVVALLALMVVLGVLFAPQLSPLVAYSYRGEERALLVRLMRLMFPAVFFTALAGAGMGIHRSYKNFVPPMWGPILYNAAIIASTYLLGRRLGVVGMAYGTVAGAFANFSLQLPFVLRKSRGRSLAIDLFHPGFRQVLRLMGPAVVSLSIYQVNFIISSNLASGLAEGSPTALRVAQTIVQLPLGVFAMGIGMVILPSLSGLAARGERAALREMFSQGIRTVFFIMIPSAVGLAVLRTPVVRLLFETGAFDAADTRMAAHALLYFTVGVWAQAGVQVLTQVYYAMQETRTLVRVSATALVLNTLLSLFFIRFTPLGHGGLALASSITVIVNLFSYLLILRKKIGTIDGTRIARSLLVAALASLVMGAAVHWTAGATAAWFQTLPAGDLWHVLLCIATGVAVYGLAAWMLRAPELRLVLETLSRRRRPSQRRGGGEEGAGLGG